MQYLIQVRTASLTISSFHVYPVKLDLLDRFLDDAIEVDVDAICDGHNVLIGGIMEHIEQAGVHSGDSACALPPFGLSPALQTEMADQVRKMALELGVIGLINTQFAVKNQHIYVLEVNPRAARTVPFVSKVNGYSLAKVGARCMAGISLKDQPEAKVVPLNFCAVKKSVFPFEKFPGVDPILGPEMRSTGEVMGIGASFGEAFAKSELAAGLHFPATGQVFLSVRDADKAGLIEVAQQLQNYGYSLIATQGTALALQQANIKCERVNKVGMG